MTTATDIRNAETVIALTTYQFAELLRSVNVPTVQPSFDKLQPKGLRTFPVTGPKADTIRKLIFLGAGLTRREIAKLAQASVSRVAEVVWSLDHEGISYPTMARTR